MPVLKFVASRSNTAAPDTSATAAPFSVNVTAPAVPVNTGASLAAVMVMVPAARFVALAAPPVLPPSLSVTVTERVFAVPPTVGSSEVLA